LANCGALSGSNRPGTHHDCVPEPLIGWLMLRLGEDQSRIRKDNAPTNVAIIRHAALNMMRQAKKKRMTIKLMRKAAGWDDSVLNSILAQVFLMM